MGGAFAPKDRYELLKIQACFGGWKGGESSRESGRTSGGVGSWLR